MPGRRLVDEGEHEWIARLLPRLSVKRGDVLVGPGDDAAVLRWGGQRCVVTTDALVEGVHFRRDWMAPRVLGRRAFRSNASDVAAMGAVPWVAVLSIIAPPALPVSCLDGIVDGFSADAKATGAALVGGNLSRGRALSISVTMLGRLTGPVVRRCGARVGDVLWVTGTLGAMGAAVRARKRGRFPLPPQRWKLAAALASTVHAMIDVSDGLAQDVGHLCRASGVAADVHLAELPIAPAVTGRSVETRALFAATAGEDYELVLAAPKSAATKIRSVGGRHGCRLTEIGQVVPGRGEVHLLGAAGRAIAPRRRGFDHFRRRA